MTASVLVRRLLPVLVLVVLALVPATTTTFFTSAVALPALWFGLAAVSLTFLAGYGGMVSLAQTALFGVGGLVMAKLVVDQGWNSWVAALVGIAAATAVGLVFGAIASGSEGIYFLVITLAFAEIVYYYFAAASTFGAHEGINGVRPPSVLGDPVLAPTRMYLLTLVICFVAYLALKGLSRTAFGLAMQGVRDDPARMTALGFNVRAHRLLGFAIAAPVAGMAGVLSAWSNTRMSAGSISLNIALMVLAAAVIGGLTRLEGAWLGALVYMVFDTYLRGWTDRFMTWLGLIFLIIVLVSPGGLTGLLAAGAERLRRGRPDQGETRSSPGLQAEPSGMSPAGTEGTSGAGGVS